MIPELVGFKRSIWEGQVVRDYKDQDPKAKKRQ